MDKFTKEEVKCIKTSQKITKALKKTKEIITCPFLGISYDGKCELCHKFMGTKFFHDEFKHPCNQLNEDEIKKRYWRNVNKKGN